WELCSKNISWQESEDDLDILIEIVRLIRPANPKHTPVVDIGNLILSLRENQDCCAILSEYIKGIQYHKKFNQFLSDAAILQDVNFFHEVRNRLSAKVLPNQPQKDRLEYVLNQVFYLATDNVWINNIPHDQLESLFDVLGFNSIYDSVEPDSPLSEMML